MTRSTRVAVLAGGAAIQVDEPRRIFRSPNNLTVATFIGTPAMNIIPATVVGGGTGLTVEVLGHRFPVAPVHCAKLEGKQRLRAGVRPQALRLGRPRPTGIRGTVFLREPLGLEDEVLVQVADGTRLKLVTASGDEFGEGAEVGLEIAPGDLYLFDADSGQALCERLD
jgi:ABC-type sugar transport system ATPase subunit